MKTPNYLKGLVIVHGKSELQMVRYISSNLHLNIKPYGRNSGRNNIQIQGLLTILKGNDFKSKRNFINRYPVETKSGRILNFKLFTIMDLDDCPKTMAKEYINGRIFAQHWLSPYIHPIINTPDLEHVLVQSGIIKTTIKKHDKGSEYIKIFPINKGIPNIEEIKQFKDKVEKCHNTNLEQFVDYCIKCTKKFI